MAKPTSKATKAALALTKGVRLQESASMSESQREFSEAMYAAAMEEGIDPMDLAFALEDRGWQRGGLVRDGELPWITRRLNIIKARMYWLMDSNAAVAVRTWTNFTLGSGMSLKAEDAGVQKQLDTFLKSPKNRTMTSTQGQHKHNVRLLVDGEMFFAIFDDDPAPSIRKVDCIEVTQFIYDPEDAEVIWCFRRERTLPNGKCEILYYRNWAYPEQDLNGVQVKDEAGSYSAQNLNDKVEKNVLMYHLPFNPIHQRGNSLFSSSLPWMTAMRQFMEDRIAITKGLARFIQKLTVKGGQSQINKIATAMELAKKPGMTSAIAPSSPAVPGGVPFKATREAAKTFLQNDNVSIDNMPRTTGASDARTDFKNIRLMIAGGMGISEPYFGDAESGNLATATAMELPMLKQFEAHQKLWQDAWVDLCCIVLYFMKGSGGEMEAIEIDVDFPPIVQKDVVKSITAIVDACAEFPELKQPEVLKMVLQVLGLNNVEEVMERVLVTAAENQKKADNVANGKNPDGSKLQQLPQPVVGPAKPAQQQTVPGGQKVAVQQAAESIMAALIAGMEEETEELEEFAMQQ